MQTPIVPAIRRSDNRSEQPNALTDPILGNSRGLPGIQGDGKCQGVHEFPRPESSLARSLPMRNLMTIGLFGLVLFFQTVGDTLA